jgi:hypothetical protein
MTPCKPLFNVSLRMRGIFSYCFLIIWIDTSEGVHIKQFTLLQTTYMRLQQCKCNVYKASPVEWMMCGNYSG